jgi:hypothetical protein
MSWDQVERELATRVQEIVSPTRTDIVRAKRAILRALDDGLSHRTGHLFAAVLQAAGSPTDVKVPGLTFSEQPSAEKITGDERSLGQLRARIAAQQGIAELTADGLLVPALDRNVDEPRPGALVESKLQIGLNYPGMQTSFPVLLSVPTVADAYRILNPSKSGHRWYLDPDIFLEDLKGLNLEERARRTLQEALSSFRRGLYLASVSLLGVVSEAAWWAAARRLSPGDQRLEKAIELPAATAKVDVLVADRLRAVKGLGKTVPDELLAHAAVLRELRNYGVHPRTQRDDLERYLAEEPAGLLLLETHNYLTRLLAAVDAAAEEGSR